MATLKCLLCGQEYIANYNTKWWLYGCEDCCGFSISKVINLSKEELNKMLKTIKNGFKELNFSEDDVLYSLHDPLLKPSEVKNILPLLCIIYNKVFLDGAYGAMFCSKGFVDTVAKLADENIIFLSELQPQLDFNDNEQGIPDYLIEGTPWQGNQNKFFYPFSKKNIFGSLELYFALENIGLALATTEVENLFQWAKRQQPYTLWDTLEKLGYFGLPQTLWINFSIINYYLAISKELKLQMIFNKNRASLINLKYGIPSPQQRKLNALIKLMKMRRLYIPEFTVKTVKKLRSSDEVEQLRMVLNDLISNRDYDFASDEEQLINEYDAAVESYNRNINKYGKKGSAILSGSLALVGGLIGGPLGAFVGGVGGASAPFGTEYIIKKHYSKNKVKWPFIFVKG